MKLKLWQKNILSMLFIIIAGFILFNVAFMLAFAVSKVYDMAMMPFAGPDANNSQLHFSWHYIFIILILLVSWFILRAKKIKELFKAAFFVLPLTVVLFETGIQFYQQPVFIWAIGAAIVGAVIYYLYRTRRSWLYYFSTAYVVAVALFVMFSGMEI